MPVASASVEPGAVLQSSPPWTGGRMASHSLDLSLALVEAVDAAEADAYLTVCLQPKQAGSNRLISAAPATGVLGLGEFAADGCHPHDESLRRDASTRMWLPLGSLSVNSYMPHGMSSIGVTCSPAASNRACQSSTSSVMM